MSFQDDVVRVFERLARDGDFSNDRQGTIELVEAVAMELECGELEVMGAITKHMALEERAKLH